VEDFAISRGYNSFALEMPEKFTTGSSAPVVDFACKARKLMLGMGFQEFMTYILTSGDKLFSKMNRIQKDVIEVENVMSDTFSVLRPSLLPILLEVESKNMRVEFPHKIFEEGEVVVVAPEENFGCKTLVNLGAIVSHGEANFSEIHSYLHSLMFYLNIPYRLEETTDPSFIDGRIGKIICRDKEVGLIGEVHPQVLENWGITVPSAAFEITLDYII
jgi:phenylalanyl-tRNA synthetase beta chain